MNFTRQQMAILGGLLLVGYLVFCGFGYMIGRGTAPAQAPQVPVVANAPQSTIKPPDTPTPVSPTATPMPIPTDTPTPSAPHIVRSLSEFEESQFCRTYHCRPGDSWDLRSGGTNNTYDITVSPLQDVLLEITTLDGRPVDFGLVFLGRNRLDSDDFQLIYSFLGSIYPGIEVDSSIKSFIEQNVEIDVFQICEANSIPFGPMRIWAGKIAADQTVSVGESCP